MTTQAGLFNNVLNIDNLSRDNGSTLVFEEGIWTPNLEFGGASTGITYTSRGGSYIRIGTLVGLRFNIQLSSKGSATGAATITGLPFNTGTTSQNAAAGRWSLITFDGGRTHLSMATTGSTSTIALQQSGDNIGIVNITDANFAATSVVSSTFIYIID